MSSSSSSASNASAAAASLSDYSNLERFLQCVTPTVPSRNPPHTPGKDRIEYFTLRDLWDCYGEWSAYGVGTPVLLNSGETVLQYYVPYLSAIQIYSNKSVVGSRSRREDSDIAEFESDSCSDDSGSDNLSRSLSNNSSRTWDVVSEDSSFDQESSCPMRDRLGHLYLQYVEMSSPYWRIPLTDKITELAQHHPALTTLKSVDLSPASWMAVAWYPIYHIPSRKSEKDLSTCFLTYHTLSSCFQECVVENDGRALHKDMCCCGSSTDAMIGEKLREDGSGRICLCPFGLATYKMQGDLWLKPETCDYAKIIDLYSAADSWLKQLSVHHHDFNFFTFHSAM
ncbi:uncharacterized protein LOC107419626 isoform X2 [Ziziphus jujuba]|uniref:Uncharacterized protein LOC107419626 isoform X2 n=1 Tax=Ziziphus jujuba TaxID=326968 RepID=A0A6P4ADV8_ZIZJJ|nr:uncharacterized protein LOC107419626 isoform X2 [Ziziphus jujuba]